MSPHRFFRESRLHIAAKWTRPIAAAATVLVLSVSLVSCGPGANGNGSTSTVSSSGGSIVHPSGSNEVVLRASTGGGFVPIEYQVTLVPEFSLYGDGRVILPGPMMELYPGPALPNIQTTLIPEGSVQAILSTAREARLFDPTFDYGLPTVADGPTTTIVINADGTTYRSEIYALRVGDAGGLTREQQQARAAVNHLISELVILSPFVPGELVWERYDFSALAVYAQAAGPDPVDVQAANRLDWPLGDLSAIGEPLPTGGFRRAVLVGEDLEKLRPVLERATEITLWKSGGIEYRLLFRPLLPDETAL